MAGLLKTIVMKRLIQIIAGLLLLAAGLSPATFAQTKVTPGSYLVVTNATFVTSMQSLVIYDGGHVTMNSGGLLLKKDLVNENAGAYDFGAGTIQFSGSTPQLITGNNIIDNLQTLNAAGITLGGNLRIKSVVNILDGQITLDSYHLTLNPLASFSGTPSATNMIVATGSGELRKEFTSPGSFLYPVGDNTGTPEYTPVNLTFNTGTFAAGSYAGVNLRNTVYPDPGITGNYLNRYWNLSQSGITGFNCNANFRYVAADVTGTESLLSCTRVNPLPWTAYGLTNTGTHTLTATGITGFSSFTGLKSTTPPVNQQVSNVNIPSGTSNCYDATQVLTIAGNGTTFTVATGGSAYLVAGQKISMLAGTRVIPGGYLHAWISNTFCNGMSSPVVSAITKETGQPELPQGTENRIRIYPNPTTDLVTVEFRDFSASMVIQLEIFNLNGQLITNKTINGNGHEQVSLAGLPVGLYVVHARGEHYSEIARIVKK